MWMWLFRSENCDAITVFGPKMAARLQGQKKNYVQLRSDRKDAKRTLKDKYIIFRKYLNKY